MAAHFLQASTECFFSVFFVALTWIDSGVTVR